MRDKNYSDAIDMRATIDERVKDIAFKFDSQVQKKLVAGFDSYNLFENSTSSYRELPTPTSNEKEI